MIMRMINQMTSFVLLLTIFVHSEVFVLQQVNFTSFLKHNQNVFVNFCTKSYPQCQSLFNQLESLSKQVENKEYVIAKLDPSSNETFRTIFKVERIPTLRLYANDAQIDYLGVRTASKMQQWIESYFVTKISTINEQEFKQKLDKECFLMIKGASQDEKKVLEIANFVDTSVDYYYSSEEGADFEISLFCKEKGRQKYEGNLTVEGLTTWTYLKTLTSLVLINSERSMKIVFENDLNLPVFLLYKTEDLSQETFDNIEQVCEQNRYNFTCGYVDSSSQIFKKTAKYMKIQNQSASALAYLKFGLKNGFIFPYLHQFTNKTIALFFQEIQQGNITSFIDPRASNKPKQKAPLQKIQYQNVLKLTKDSFRNTLDSNDYVFVEYYSPTCGHCVQFAPQYQKLAKKVKDQGLNYIIAAVDTNQEEGLKRQMGIQRLPTFKLYVKGIQIDYDAQRSIESMLEFIKKAQNSKLQVAPATIQKPFITISGVTEDSHLHMLPLLFSKYPIYQKRGQNEFKIDVHTSSGFSSYSEQDSTLKDIVEWLQLVTEPTIIKLAQQKNSKKLIESIKQKTPLLVVVQRDSSVQNVLKIFQRYCNGVFHIICGSVLKGDFDYDSFNKWLDDDKPQQSVVLIIDSTDWKKYMFVGDLNKLTEKSLGDFVEAVVSKIKKDKKTEDLAQKVKIDDKKPQQKERQNKGSKKTLQKAEVSVNEL